MAIKIVKITKEIAEGRLGNVPDDKRFWCSDGRVLKNLQELETALIEISDETFRQHSNEAKNDFCNWVRDLILDEKLSRDLLKSTNRLQAAKNVSSRIAFLKSKLI